MKGVALSAETVSSTKAKRARIRLVPDAVVGAVDRRFLSVSIDATRFIDAPAPLAAPVDLTEPTLVALSRALAPAYLRIGGPVADRTFYELRTRAKGPPPGFAAVLTAAHWDAATSFAQEVGFALMFTLNAGRSTRTRSGAWQQEQARLLVEHASARRDPVLVWAFGHEAAGDRPVFDGHEIRRDQYAQDLLLAARLVRDGAQSKLSGSLAPFGDDAAGLTRAGEALDVITWRYPPAPRDPPPHASVDPRLLDDVASQADDVGRARTAAGAETKPMWLGQTDTPSHQPLAWIDQLGILAQRGQSVVVRNALLGGPSALIDEATLLPRLDFWTSVLWKRLMGREVLAPDCESSDAGGLRAYAHWSPRGTGLPDDAVTLVLVNLDDEAVEAELVGLPLAQALAFRFEADEGEAPRINGRPLMLESDGSLPTIVGCTEALDPAEATLRLGPHSFGFFVLAPTGATFDSALLSAAS